jgi:hypothetical protein
MAVDNLNLEAHEHCGVTKFDGSNSTIWRFRMMIYIKALGLDVWECVSAEYVPPINPPSSEKECQKMQKQ